MTMTQEHARPMGLAKELARAIGWLAVSAGVSKLPGTASEPENNEDRPRREASVRPSKLVTAFASLVGLVLALVPRGPRPRVQQLEQVPQERITSPTLEIT